MSTRRRRSIFSSLGVLELDHGSLSLRNAKGVVLFDVPAASVEARPRPRMAFSQAFFQVRAAGRWWQLVARTPTRHQRRSTRELIERWQARAVVPRLRGMNEDDYQLLTTSSLRHQILWKECWLALLRRAADLGDDGSPAAIRDDP